jgi:hypothetical protein
VEVPLIGVGGIFHIIIRLGFDVVGNFKAPGDDFIHIFAVKVQAQHLHPDATDPSHDLLCLTHSCSI